MFSDEFSTVHLIGIGGTGLSAIARVLLESGYRVSGSDQQLSPLATSLIEAGAQVFIGHRAENVQGADLVIRSSAVRDDNVEVQAALAAGIPVMKRADFLGKLMDGQIGIAIAGTHGKTTTTAMVAWMLTVLKQDPSYIIGGVSANLGSNAHAGKGRYFVVEADEYDRMFLGLHPKAAVVTNVEHDHPDCYPTEEGFYQAFKHFVHCLSPEGWLVACADDPGASRLAQEAREEGIEVYSYGLSAAQADYNVKEVKLNSQGGQRFTAFYHNDALGKVELQVPGMHNLRNALAALAIAHRLELPLAVAREALGEFRGTGRRFELLGEAGGIAVIDDYAHHPTEIRATLAAARSRYAGRRVWAVWQPHTYSRTRTLFNDFVEAFQDADRVIVTEVYAAREADQVGTFSARQLAEAIQSPKADFFANLNEATAYLLQKMKAGDVMIVLSAGDADQICGQVLAGLKERQGEHV
jgi:UDP-N-acetylmuramate--alanine ligase